MTNLQCKEIKAVSSWKQITFHGLAQTVRSRRALSFIKRCFELISWAQQYLLPRGWPGTLTNHGIRSVLTFLCDVFDQSFLSEKSRCLVKSFETSTNRFFLPTFFQCVEKWFLGNSALFLLCAFYDKQLCPFDRQVRQIVCHSIRSTAVWKVFWYSNKRARIIFGWV